MSEQKGTKIKIWFCSDLHLGHKSVLYFHPERREAAGITMEELQEDKNAAIKKHDEWLIDKWNKTIAKGDFVYILGDFCLGNKEYTEKILNRLKGRKFLIRGNHDKSCNGLERYFEWVGDIKEVKFTHNQYPFIDENETFALEMCHYPMLTWNRKHYGAVHLHGHEHGHIDMHNFVNYDLRFDVGLDSHLTNFRPLSLEDVNRLVERKTTGYSIASYIEKYKRQMLF